jgi:DNA-nicking Smr family endonuclease
MASVRPLRAVRTPVVAKPVPPPPPPAATSKGPIAVLQRVPPPVKVAPRKPPQPGVTLDGGWDKRLSRGMIIPDATIDLHGHTLHSAHDLLDHALDRAIRRGDRVILLVTGKPPRPESERPHARGAIRAAIGDWLASSRHAGAIAAVRGAHPRHGGQGALYIVLRRAKGV